ncbi:MAG: hypothetical protein KJ638_12025 [Chloroflexi bacterium]|nr:hypothetical protein [Chloroflexota bacterium]
MRLIHAQVRLTNVYQVELEADVTNTPAELRRMAADLAVKEYGDADIVEVEEIEDV